MPEERPTSPSLPDGQYKRKEEIEYNDAIEDLLCEEAEKCSGLSWMHSEAEKIFRNKNNWIQIPIIVVSTLSGSFQIGISNSFDPRITQALGSLSLIVSMLGMINSHYRYAQRAEAHKVASVQYGHINRLISMEMSLTRNQRIPAKYLLKMVKDDLKGFNENFPRVPNKVVDLYKVKIQGKSDPGVAHPDLISGIKEIIPFDREKTNCTPVSDDIITSTPESSFQTHNLSLNSV